jgi:hypothetical protein
MELIWFLTWWGFDSIGADQKWERCRGGLRLGFGHYVPLLHITSPIMVGEGTFFCSDADT